MRKRIGQPIFVAIAGQSQGRGFQSTGLPAEYQGPLTRNGKSVRIWTPTGFQVMQVGVNNTPGDPSVYRWGADVIALAKLRDYFGQDIYVAKYCVGGTGLASDGGAQDWAPASAELYTAFLAQVQGALSALGGASAVRDIFLWWQGERDATNSTWAAGYGTNLAAMVSALRTATSLDGPVVIPYLHRQLPAGSYAHADTVRAAQIAYAQPGNANNAVGIDPHKWQVDEADNIHYSVAGQVQAGLDIFQVLKRVIRTGAEADLIAPSAPANLAASNVQQTSLTLTWSPSTDNRAVAAYRVFQDAVQIATVTAPATTYNVTGLTAGTSYDFAVRAVDAAGNVSDASTLTESTLPSIVPGDAETAALLALGYTPQEAATFIARRYGLDTILRPDPAAVVALFSGVGDRFVEPTFGFEMIVMATNVNQINAERRHWNSDGSKFFIRVGSTAWQVYNGDTLAPDGNPHNLVYNGTNPTDAVRWHPSQPNILFYPIGADIIFYNVATRSSSVFATSPHGTLGTGNRRLAGGDGNDGRYNSVRQASYILISHGGNNTGCQVLNLDTGTILRTSWDGTNWVYIEIPWDAQSPTFTLPAGTLFDYAMLDIPDPVTGHMYIISAADGIGTSIHDVNGAFIGTPYTNANHMNPVRYQGQSGVVMKTPAGLVGSTDADSSGDMLVIFWTVNVNPSDGTRSLTSGNDMVLDWDGEGPIGGGQHSAWSAVTNRMIMAMGEPEYLGYSVPAQWTSWGYGEAIEISLDAADPASRRLFHNSIGNYGTVGDQPEVWYSPDGTRAIFKTDWMGQLGSQYVFGVFLPERNALANR